MTSKNDGRVVSVEDAVTVTSTRMPIPINGGLNLNTSTDLDGLLWIIAGGYALNEMETSSLDVFAGARFFGFDELESDG